MSGVNPFGQICSNTKLYKYIDFQHLRGGKANTTTTTAIMLSTVLAQTIVFHSAQSFSSHNPKTNRSFICPFPFMHSKEKTTSNIHLFR